jgi:pyrrolidone-carboxylate peptidase
MAMATMAMVSTATVASCAGRASKGADEPDRSLRVLVTGFNDWEDLGEPPNVWRCRDNPSCRLLLGQVTQSRPTSIDQGPLVRALRDARPEVEWSFQTLPVTWGVADDVDIGDFDLVVHLGLGVYDSFDRLKLELDAYNMAKGTDAAGEQRQDRIEPSGDMVLVAPVEIRDAVKALNGAVLGGFVVEIGEARADNSYLCNETHYRSLHRAAAHAAGPRVHFVHIPRAEDDDYRALTDGVAAMVTTLVDIASSG